MQPRALTNLAALVIIVAGLYFASSIVTMLLVAIFVSMVTAPAVLWLRQKKIPSVLAALLIVAALLGVSAGLGALVGASINGFVEAAPVYRARLNDQMQTALVWLQERGLDVYGMDLLRSIQPGSVMSAVGDVVGAFGGLLGNSLLILLIVTFILLEVPGMPRKFQSAFPQSADSLERFSLIAANVERYVILKTLVSFATGVLAGLWVAILGVDFALVWGMLAFLLNYIPNFGSILAAAPPILMALVQHGVGEAVLVAAGFLVVNLALGNVLEPRLMGRSMGLSTLVVILSLLAWGWILGTPGMFLAVPLTMALKIILESDSGTRWIAVLMGPEREADQPASMMLSKEIAADDSSKSQ